MEGKEGTYQRHESVDHTHPTDAGLMDPDHEQVPATGVMGDETLVRRAGEDKSAYPLAEGDLSDRDTHEDATPGPTTWTSEGKEGAG